MAEQKFILTYGSESEELTINPDGWNRNGQSWERHKKYHGVIRSKTVDTFRFVFKTGGGGDFILNAYNTDDIKAIVTVDVYDRNPQTGGFDLSYSGRLNFEIEELRIERDWIEIGFIQSGDIQNFITRDEIDIDVRDNISIDGTAISDVGTNNITYKGISIQSFAQSDGNMNGEIEMTDLLPDGGFIYYTEEEEQANEIGSRYQLNSGTETIYENDQPTSSILKVGIKAISNNSQAVFTRTFPISDATLRIRFVLQAKNSVGTITSQQTVYENNITVAPIPAEGKTVPVVIAIADADLNHKLYDITIPPGGTCEYYTDVFTLSINNATVTYTQVCDTNIKIYEKSTSVGDSDVSGYFAEEALTKLLRLYLSRNDVLYSEYFGKIASTLQSYTENGFGAFNHIITGYNARGFLDRQFVLNFSDLFQSLDAIHNLMCGYDYVNNRFFIEEKARAYDADTIIYDLGEITDLVITPYKDAYYNIIQGGYEEKGDYEEFQGSLEFNLNYELSINQPVKDSLKIRSKYNTDSIGVELARRKPYSEYASTDTKQDEKIYVNDTDGVNVVQGGTDVEGFGGIEERYNIAFTPRENIIRWGNFINSGLWKEGSFEIKFVSAKKSFNIKYRNQNGDLVNEFDNISSDELGDIRLFNPQYYEFKGKYSLDIDAAILANPHGLFNFTFDGVGYSGFIDQVVSQDYNRTGEYKLIAYIPQSDIEMIWDDTTEINALFEDEQQIIFD